MGDYTANCPSLALGPYLLSTKRKKKDYSSLREQPPNALYVGCTFCRTQKGSPGVDWNTSFGISSSLQRDDKTEANHWQQSGFGRTRADKKMRWQEISVVANYWQKEMVGKKMELTDNLYLTTSLNPAQSSVSSLPISGKNWTEFKLYCWHPST